MTEDGIRLNKAYELIRASVAVRARGVKCVVKLVRQGVLRKSEMS